MSTFSKYLIRVTKPSIYATNAGWEYLKFFIGSLVAAVITYLIISSIPVNLFSGKFLNIAIALVLGAGISFLAFSIFFYGENRKAFMYLHKIKTRGRDYLNQNQKSIFDFIRSEYDSLLYDLVRIQHEQIKSTYTNQIKLASIFNSLAKEKFFATSFDLPSQFYSKNKDYLNTMNNCNNKIVGVSGGIPNKTRIFICSLDEFIEDIYQYPKSFIFLIKWHLDWHKKTETGKTNSPIKFFLYKDEEEKSEFETYFKDLENENKIPDFMLVDNKLVYGRIEKNIITNNQVSLRAIVSKEYSNIFGKYNGKIDDEIEKTIQKYNHIFMKIYEKSIEPEEIEQLLYNGIDRFKDEMVKIDDDLKLDPLKPFSSQIYKLSVEDLKRRKELLKIEIKSKIKDYNDTQDRNTYYQSVFGGNENGIKFTNKWIELMEDSSNECFALDTADLRKGKTRFLDKWEEDELYKEFLSASSKAVKQKNAKFRRVFILESKLNESEKLRFHSFLKECVIDYGIEVGIILMDELIKKNILDDKVIQLETDFVLLNVENSKLANKNIYGFKISKTDDFKPNMLSFSNNLIIPNEFKYFYTLFNKIYSQSTKFANKTDINMNEKVDLFINPKK